MKRPFSVMSSLVVLALAVGANPQSASSATPAGPLVKKAATGHVTNYDESRVGEYQLPDPLVAPDGRKVTTDRQWLQTRRPELIDLYAREIFGKVPEGAPQVRSEVLGSGEPVANGLGTRKRIVLHFGSGARAPKAELVLYSPAAAGKPAPVLLHIVFLRGLPAGDEPAAVSAQAAGAVGMTPRTTEIAPVEEVLRRGYAYATFRYTDVQPDRADTATAGVIAQAYAPGQTKPASDEWGAISVWAWAASRALDRLGEERNLDARRVALIGHSRLGKTALWASAQDPRFALVFASCSGEMGAALSRRDYGETVDDMAEVFPWWFAGNFQKYAGNWNSMPVDAHTLIALSAPRPVFITGATEDHWADPKGEFLAAVAAGPVYRLLGVRDLGTTTLPPLDVPLLEGRIGWLYHTGPHAIMPIDWKAFLAFADLHLK